MTKNKQIVKVFLSQAKCPLKVSETQFKFRVSKSRNSETETSKSTLCSLNEISHAHDATRMSGQDIMLQHRFRRDDIMLTRRDEISRRDGIGLQCLPKGVLTTIGLAC